MSIETKTKHIPTSVLSGYMIQRPTHLEINVKSTLIHSLLANDKDKVYDKGFGYLYANRHDYPDTLFNCMAINSHTLLQNPSYPNLVYLRSDKLNEGIKVKIRGIILPFELEMYEQKFKEYVYELVKFLKHPPKPTKLINSRITEIRNGFRFDAYGWVHMKNCNCMFSNYKPISLGTTCEKFGVKLDEGNESQKLQITTEGRRFGLN